jgi:hypothetical protein
MIEAYYKRYQGRMATGALVSEQEYLSTTYPPGCD